MAGPGDRVPHRQGWNGAARAHQRRGRPRRL